MGFSEWLREKFGRRQMVEKPKYSAVKDWKKDLKTIWSGESKTIEFTYESGSKGSKAKRRKVDLKRVVVDGRGEIYLQGFCHTAKDERSFSFWGVESDIRWPGHRRDLHWFLRNELDLEEELEKYGL